MTGDFAQFDLMREIADSEWQKPWSNGIHARILTKKPDFRVVLISMATAARLKKHHVDGTSSVQVLKGHIRYSTGGQAYDLPWVKARFEASGSAPDCTACDEPVKTATISFGQAMPEDAMRHATELAQQCDLFLAIGSSLVVWPAAGFPMLAKNSGARLVIINNEPTEQDDIADLVIRHDIGETLGPIVGN